MGGGGLFRPGKAAGKSMGDTKTASFEALRAMKKRGEIAATWPNAEAVELPDGFWDNAKLAIPTQKKQISLRVDSDIIEFFKSRGGGHLTRMHAVLRTYVDAQRAMHRP